MRNAYAGRAAAYEKKSELENALRDYTQVTLLYSVEIEVLDQQDAPDRGKVLTEAADAYRDRARVRQALKQTKGADADRQHAERLDAKAKKLAAVAAKPADLPADAGRIQVTNAWTEPVDVIIEGTRYTLKTGEQKALTRVPGTFRYEVPSASYRGEGKVETGKTYPIWIGPAGGAPK